MLDLTPEEAIVLGDCLKTNTSLTELNVSGYYDNNQRGRKSNEIECYFDVEQLICLKRKERESFVMH